MTSLEPLLPPHLRKTYRIASPLTTHWRTVTCAEYECLPYLNGWTSRIDERTDLGQAQARYIRFNSGRSFKEERDEAGMTLFHFEPGQQPFDDAERTHSTHKLPIGKPELFIVRGGDHRGNPRQEFRRHARPEDWVDDFANHQQKIADAIQKG